MTSRMQEKVASAAVDDAAITQRIRTELNESLEVRDKDCAIEIATTGGQVVLSGTAAGRDEIRRALKIALTTPGVRMVRNDIQLRAADEPAPLAAPGDGPIVAAAVAAAAQ